MRAAVAAPVAVIQAVIVTLAAVVHLHQIAARRRPLLHLLHPIRAPMRVSQSVQKNKKPNL